MRRDNFAVGVSESGTPTLDITYEGPPEELASHLTDDSGEVFDAERIDAAFRLQEPLDENGETTGVFSLTHRLTGAYLLEVNVAAEALLGLVEAARDAAETASYRIRIAAASADETDPVVYEMSALFVYDSDGELLRQRSLIPSGVEL
jgi:hypothetical protein